MARIQYRYNPTTCDYERITHSKWDILVKAAHFLTTSFVLALGIFWSYTTHFDSPKEARLKRENEQLKAHYNQLQQAIDQSHQVLAHLQEQDHSLYRMILEIEPRPYNESKKHDVRYQKTTDQDVLIAHTFQKVNHLQQKLSRQAQSYDELRRLAKENEKRLAAIPSIQPLSNKDLRRLSSPFGMRIHPVHKVPCMHEGIDFAAPRGTPIYATGNGVVKRTRKSTVGYGNHVIIDHGYGYLTSYCHMQRFIVKPGQKVTRGQCIGYVGSTGTSTSPHLHYEVIKNRRKVNPAHYFTNDLDAQQYDMLLELAARKIRASS